MYDLRFFKRSVIRPFLHQNFLEKRWNILLTSRKPSAFSKMAQRDPFIPFQRAKGRASALVKILSPDKILVGFSWKIYDKKGNFLSLMIASTILYKIDFRDFITRLYSLNINSAICPRAQNPISRSQHERSTTVTFEFFFYTESNILFQAALPEFCQQAELVSKILYLSFHLYSSSLFLNFLTSDFY